MSKRTGRKPKRERTSRRRTRRHSSASETSSEDVPPKTRASSRVDAERKVALTIKLPPSPGGNDCNEENTTGMWKVECSNGSDGDIQKLKISLRRSPKDLLREQAAEAKYSAERKAAEEAAGSSTNLSALDGSVTNYLEQFGSSVAVEETKQNLIDSNEQEQVVIPTNESSFNQDYLCQTDSNQVESSVISSDFVTSQEESNIENISADNNKLIDKEVCESIVDANEIHEEAVEQTVIEEKLINLSESVSDSAVHPTFEECKIPEPNLEVTSVNITEVLSSDVNISEPFSESIQNIQPKSNEIIVDESKTSKLIEVENGSTVESSKTAINLVEESSKIDNINDSEQMDDVVQLTVESPDFVDDEDHKAVDEDEPKPVDEEIKLIDKEELKEVIEESTLVNDEGIKPIEESFSIISSDRLNSKQVSVEKEFKLDETSTLYDSSKSLSSSHPKRKWGSCKTRTPITIIPFTLGTIIESNSDSIGDNGEYRSEEGEIQRTDSDEEQDVDESMEISDTMLIGHEAVDYEAPEEEEKPDNFNEDSKSDKSLVEETIEVEPKKKSSGKRLSTTSVIRITNLVRPFTVGQLRDLLQRTGKIVSNGFWIDTIKSQCIVEYENEDQAIETVYALNESQWPSTNPKFLKVVFTNKEELNKALNGTHPDRSGKQKESKVEKLRTHVDNHIILREWDRGKLEDMNGEKEDKPVKRKISDDPHLIKDKKAKKDEIDQDKRKKSKSKTPERIPTKSLDELFRKTKTTPTLYWSPLSTEQIAEKEDQRRKHLAEMERSQKTNRRRRDNNHYSRRR